MGQYGDDVIPVVGKGLVELVEAGLAQTPQAAAQVRHLLASYMDEQVDAIVLGCTHFPFLRNPIQQLFPGARIFDGREGTVLRLKSLLEQQNLCSDDTPGRIEYHTSGGPEIIPLMRDLMRALD